MKKLLLICASSLFLTACADKELYQQAVLTEMQQEQDIKDYNIDPEEMTECVVDTSSKKMPGVFPLDPDRLIAYRNYAKMLSMSTTENPKETFNELRSTFGSAKELGDAHGNYTKSFMDCINVFIQRSEESEEKK